MSRHSTPTFRIEYPSVRDAETERPIGFTSGGWDTKHCGRPTDASLARWVASLEASMLPGGCNAHIGICVVRHARVVRQASGEIVAMFRREAR